MPAIALNPLELTGRATTHVVTLHDPPCTLHPDVVEPFFRLRAAAAREGLEVVPVSTFRDFGRQLAIWNAKCRGERDLFDRDGTLLDYASLSEDELVTAILHWSALPGASRHHWGTEIDVIDGAATEPGGRVELLPDEYAPGGRYARLEAWLAANAERFGFYRPYATDRGGVSPEPWHLSYAPVAARAQRALSVPGLRAVLAASEIDGKEAVLASLEENFRRYVVDVDPPPESARLSPRLA